MKAYSRRLQVQERLGEQIKEALTKHLSQDVMVVIKACHLCMESRGVCSSGQVTKTSVVSGLFKESSALRAEFLSL